MEKMAMWRDIARVLAHEIRGPLTPLQMLFKKLENSYRGNDDKFKKLLSEVSEIAKQEIGTLTQMCNRFSSFAKYPEINIETCDVSESIMKFVESHEDAWHNLTISTELQPVYCKIDSQAFTQVLRNMLQNASEATQNKIKVEIITEKHDDVCQVTIANNGPLIPDVVLPDIFEKYISTKGRIIT